MTSYLMCDGVGDLVPGQLARAGKEHHRGCPHQPQTQHSLHRGQYSEQETHSTMREILRRSTSTGCT